MTTQNNGRFMDFVSSNTTRRTKPVSVTTSRMPFTSSFSARTKVSTQVITKPSRPIVAKSVKPQSNSKIYVPSSAIKPTSSNTSRIMPSSTVRSASSNTSRTPTAYGSTSSKTTSSKVPFSINLSAKNPPSTTKIIQKPVIPTSSTRRIVKYQEIEETLGVIEEVNSLKRHPESTNNVEHKSSESPAKPTFINLDKIDKRPLSPFGPDPVKKNVYEKRLEATKNSHIPTTIVSSPSKSNSIFLAIAILFTIILGIGLGIVAYFAVTNQ